MQVHKLQLFKIWISVLLLHRNAEHMSVHGSTVIDIVQQGKSALHKAILKMGGLKTKKM